MLLDFLFRKATNGQHSVHFILNLPCDSLTCSTTGIEQKIAIHCSPFYFPGAAPINTAHQTVTPLTVQTRGCYLLPLLYLPDYGQKLPEYPFGRSATDSYSQRMRRTISLISGTD